MIELRHLRYFRVVAEEQNFHRAAERIPVDLSALSRAVRELEEHVGVFRFSRGLQLVWGDSLQASSFKLGRLFCFTMTPARHFAGLR